MTDKVNGFSMKLPAGYTWISDKTMLRSLMKAGAGADPKLQAAFDKFAPLVEQARVFAMRLGSIDAGDNLNVIVGSAGGRDAERIGDSYGDVKQVLEEQLGATITGHSIIKLAGTKGALRVEYGLRMGNTRMWGTQVYVIHNGKVLTVTITHNGARADSAGANTLIDGLRVQ